MIWYPLWIFSILVFYEHFVEHDRTKRISPNFKYGLLPSLAVLVAILVIFFTEPGILKFRYAYLLLGLCAIMPLIFLIMKKPALINKFVMVSVFFFFLYLTFELTSLKLGHWSFPGQYIGRVELLGVTFPLEELFFWILLSSSAVMSYYELYVDDER